MEVHHHETLGTFFSNTYRAFGAAPTVESYVALFEQGATLLHPGMAELIRIRSNS